MAALMMSYFVDIVAAMKASVSSSAGGARVVGVSESRAEQRSQHRAWRCGGLAVAGLLALAPISTRAEHAPRGLVRYDHPVFRNGKRMLWHGAWRAAGAHTRVAAAEPAKPASAPEPKSPVSAPDREIIVVAE